MMPILRSRISGTGNSTASVVEEAGLVVVTAASDVTGDSNVVDGSSNVEVVAVSDPWHANNISAPARNKVSLV
jgi:hypothetical protein